MSVFLHIFISVTKALLPINFLGYHLLADFPFQVESIWSRLVYLLKNRIDFHLPLQIFAVPISTPPPGFQKPLYTESLPHFFCSVILSFMNLLQSFTHFKTKGNPSPFPPRPTITRSSLRCAVTKRAHIRQTQA